MSGHASTVSRVVVVHGAAGAALEAALHLAGLEPLLATATVTVWTPLPAGGGWWDDPGRWWDDPSDRPRPAGPGGRVGPRRRRVPGGNERGCARGRRRPPSLGDAGGGGLDVWSLPDEGDAR